jgi:hypothetical protein
VTISNPLIRSYVWVVAWWWLLAMVVLLVQYPSLTFSIDGLLLYANYTAYSVLFGVAGVMFSTMVMFFYASVQHGSHRVHLQSDSLRGMQSTLGPVPVAQLSTTNNAQGERWFKKHTQHGAAVCQYASTIQTRHPQHYAMLIALLNVYAQWPTLPASWEAGQSSRYTLADHCSRVCMLAIEQAQSFAYSGLCAKVSKTSNRINTDSTIGVLALAPGDPNYVFDPSDPLIAIAALAHDLGKLGAYLMDARGQIIGIKSNHDALGAQLLARMSETFALPPSDRNALLRSIAHHHRADDYPVNQSGQIDDDRTVALMMLLIKADNAAQQLESRVLS